MFSLKRTFEQITGDDQQIGSFLKNKGNQNEYLQEDKPSLTTRLVVEGIKSDMHFVNENATRNRIKIRSLDDETTEPGTYDNIEASSSAEQYIDSDGKNYNNSEESVRMENNNGQSEFGDLSEGHKKSKLAKKSKKKSKREKQEKIDPLTKFVLNMPLYTFAAPADILMLIGPPGARGKTGPPGSMGVIGFPGRPGSPGQDGPIGERGPTGSPGVPGQRGEQGLSGGVGSPGDIGDQGQDGFIGPPGSPGQVGEEAQIPVCREYEVIHIIKAYYGRNDLDICSDAPDGMKSNILCEGDQNRIYLKVVDQCQNREACELVASNIFFDDNSCPDVYKFLTICHECIPDDSDPMVNTLLNMAKSRKKRNSLRNGITLISKEK
uniref:Putative nematogalectin n=1 Tax=Sphaeromyxa zaharoni TaxID=275449 RepID=A0A090DBJ3_9CNID|nr:putative nematogalectin [Sphaeromyxa zaharoni]